MFAFIIADLSRRSLFFARDQLGIKPLFICETPESVFFASEIKAFMPAVKLEPDFDSIKEYLVFRSLPGENTMFKNVRKLGAGHFGTWADGVLRTSQYFNLAETLRPDSDIDFESACAVAEELLSQSVRLHLRSDVELGVQLSGGVDSSLITALSSKISGRRLHSFSISFEEAFFDESEYQKRVSKRYDTEHHDYRMNEEIFTGMIRDAIWHYEEGLNDPNSVCTYYLALKAKEHVTVMLSGEGADETFLGYARFNRQSIAIMRRRTFLYKHPALRKALLALWPFPKGRDLLRITKYCPSVFALSYCDLNHIDDLVGGDDCGLFNFRKEVSENAGGDIVAQAILQDEICDLPQWFVRADKMGMAASLEFRVPFCTEKMFRLANSMPLRVKLHGGERKAILKKIAEKYIDKDQIYRKKIGFGTPVDTWINRNGVYCEIFDDIVNSQSFKSRDFIHHPHFKKLYDAHKNGSYRELSAKFLWTYFNLELWFRIFFEEGRGL